MFVLLLYLYPNTTGDGVLFYEKLPKIDYTFFFPSEKKNIKTGKLCHAEENRMIVKSREKLTRFSMFTFLYTFGFVYLMITREY